MIYNDRLTPPNNWPPLVQYPSYYSNRRLSILWFLAFAILALLLSVIALIIVFAVEHSWFHDTFLGSTTRYGLWRLCFFNNGTCDSWFTTDSPLGATIEQRLNQSKAGINAWQALEIIFLFLTTATLIIAVLSLICYRIRHGLHYYMAILAVFCVWPAACIGVASLFVFGFAVYNVSGTPRDLDWCFYVNLAAVVLVVIATILLSIYDALLKKPMKNYDDGAVIETFADLNGYPAALSPSTFVIVRQNKKKRNKPYDYPQVLHPNHYFPTAGTTTNEVITNSNYVTNPNHQMSTPYTSVVTTHETNTATQPQQQQQQHQSLTPYRGLDYTRSNLITSPSTTNFVPQPPVTVQTQSYRTNLAPDHYQPRSSPPYWHRTGTNAMNQSFGYASEPVNEYVQPRFYPATRTNLVARTFEQKQEPRVMHYYTGYDYFATIDPTDTVLSRRHPPMTGPGSAIRYGGNTASYHSQDDYIKSVM